MMNRQAAYYDRPSQATAAALYGLLCTLEGQAMSMERRSSSWNGVQRVPWGEGDTRWWRRSLSRHWTLLLRFMARNFLGYSYFENAYLVGEFVIDLLQDDRFATAELLRYCARKAHKKPSPPSRAPSLSDVMDAEMRQREQDPHWREKRRQCSHEAVALLYKYPPLSDVLFSPSPPSEITLDLSPADAQHVQRFINTFQHLNPRLNGPVTVTRHEK